MKKKKDTKDESIARSFLKIMFPELRKTISKLSGPRCLELFSEKKNEV